MNFGKHIIKKGTSLNDALFQLNQIDGEKILFIVDDDSTYIGSVTDGDIRRGLIHNGSLEQKIESFNPKKSKFLFENNFDLHQLIELRENGYRVIPIIDDQKRIKHLVNFNDIKSYLNIDSIIMAGGRGSRLSPLTDNTPKSMLMIEEKPIMEHNFDRLISFGVKNFWVSVNYLKEQIIEYFEISKKEIGIRYIEEDRPMGTIGALSMVDDFQNEHLLITNSDLLTNLNYEDFYLDFLKHDADISLVTIPYEVTIPYGIIDQKQNQVKEIREKPTYTYYSNAGIYLMKREVLASIPKNTFFDATDLIMNEISKKKKVISYPFSGYWLDIGKPEDFKRAPTDLKQIKF